MKTLKFLLTTIAVLLGSVMANAYDFEVVEYITILFLLLI